MSLLTGRGRGLRGIERDLAGSDPRLAALFRAFTMLARGEPLPRLERVSSLPVRLLLRPWTAVSAHRHGASRRLLWPAVVYVVVLAALACAVALGLSGRSTPRVCLSPAAMRYPQQSSPSCAKGFLPGGK